MDTIPVHKETIVAKFQAGDFFSFEPSSGLFLCGRIQLNVQQQCWVPKLITAASPLSFFQNTLLVEIYQEQYSTPTYRRSPVLINGLFTDQKALTRGQWKVGGQERVDPTGVEFPEALVSTGTGALFQRGEVSLPLPLDTVAVSTINVYPAIQPSIAVPDIALYYLGLKNLASHSHESAMRLDHFDLRFSSHRAEIYQRLKQDPSESYFSLALRLGHDVRRFYR